MRCIECKANLPVEIPFNDLCPYCGKFSLKSILTVIIAFVLAVPFAILYKIFRVE